MEFYQELLNSYSLLKKRKLKVSLQEQTQETFSTIDKKADGNNEAAKSAIANTNAELEGVFQTSAFIKNPGAVNTNAAQTIKIVPGAQEAKPKPKPAGAGEGAAPAPAPTQSFNWEGQTGANPFITQKEGSWNVNKQEWDNYRSALARAFFTGAAQEYAGSLGVSPTNDEVVGLLQSTYGSKLVEEFGEEELRSFLDITKYLDDPSFEDLPKGFLDPDSGDSVFAIAAKSLDPSNKVASKLHGLFPAMDEAVKPEEILSGLKGLQYMLYLTSMAKAQQPPTFDQAQNMLDRMVILKDGKQKKVFFKAEGDSGVGIAFISKSKDPMFGIVEEYQDYIDAMAKDDEQFLDLVPKTVDLKALRTDSSKAVKANTVITDVSEELDTIITLIMQGESKKAAERYKDLQNKWDNGISECVGVVEGVNSSEFVATQEVAELQEFLNTLDEEYQGNFKNLVNAVGKRRLEALRKRGPAAIWRVGTGSGAEGDKKDQVLIYNTAEEAEKGGNSGSSIKKATLKEIFVQDNSPKSKENFKEFMRTFGREGWDENTEVYFTGESLKWTVSPTITSINLGGSKSTTKIANEWASGHSYSRTINQALGMDDVDSANVDRRFGSLAKSSASIERLMGAITPSMTQQDMAEKIATVFGEKSNLKKDFGIDVKDLKRILKTKKGDQEVQGILTRAAHLKMIKEGLGHRQENVRRSWRQVEACLILRNAFDKDNSYDVLEDMTDAKTYRHKRNDTLLNVLIPYIKGDESVKRTQAETQFSIGGITMSMSSVNNTSCTISKNVLKAGGQGAKAVGEEKQLLAQLLDVQQKLFSKLLEE